MPWPSLLADRHRGDRGQSFGEESKVRAAVERTKDAAVIGAEDDERAVRGQTRRIDVVVEPWQTLTAHELRVAVERLPVQGRPPTPMSGRRRHQHRLTRDGDGAAVVRVHAVSDEAPGVSTIPADAETLVGRDEHDVS